jgi:hypothetical protein
MNRHDAVGFTHGVAGGRRSCGAGPGECRRLVSGLGVAGARPTNLGRSDLIPLEDDGK